MRNLRAWRAAVFLSRSPHQWMCESLLVRQRLGTPRTTPLLAVMECRQEARKYCKAGPPVKLWGRIRSPRKSQAIGAEIR